jgi:acyl-CoA thioester hydrolase
VEHFSRTFVVRWADCDANGHLRNTCYSEYAIEVRMAFLAEHGLGLADFRRLGFGPVLLREEIDYLRECHMGEQLRVDLKLLGESADQARFKMLHEVSRPDGKVAARLVVHAGWMDMRTRRLAPPPEELQRQWGQVERAEPFELLPPLGSK